VLDPSSPLVVKYQPASQGQKIQRCCAGSCEKHKVKKKKGRPGDIDGYRTGKRE
jgi:hypothetical protein